MHVLGPSCSAAACGRHVRIQGGHRKRDEDTTHGVVSSSLQRQRETQHGPDAIVVPNVRLAALAGQVVPTRTTCEHTAQSAHPRYTGTGAAGRRGTRDR